MQVKAVTVNAANMAAGWNRQGNGNQVQSRESIFGAECKVTISREGKELSRQQADGTEKSAQQAKAERMLLRQQEESRLNEDMKRSYREKLKEMEDTADYLNNSYNKIKDKEMVEKEQAVQADIRRQKQFQMEENQRRAREAQQMAALTTEYQEEIDENNRDLLTLLKTMEAAEEAEDRQENGRTEADNSATVARNNSPDSVSDAIQKAAASVTAVSLRNAAGVEEAIAGLNEEGHQMLSMADSVTRGVLHESAGIRAALEDDSFTDEEIAMMMKDFQERGAGIGAALEDDQEKMPAPSSYDYIKYYRSRGLQNLQDAQEWKIQHLGDDPLGGMAETKKSMMLSAVDAAYGEAAQGGLDKVSQELKDELEKLIDERNDIEGIRQEEEQQEQEDEQEEALDGLLQPEESLKG